MNNETNPASEEEKKDVPVAETSPEVKEEKTSADSQKKETAGRDKSKAEKQSKKDKKKETEQEAPKEPDAAGQTAEANDRYLRLMAEYDNFRKRSQKERESIYSDVKADTVTKFLPVYDNLVRALEQSTQDEAYRRGVEMIMTQFEETLTKLGITEIDSVGQKFDPNVHNAVMHVDDDTKGENEVVEVFQRGFRLGDKIIRFAMVKVAN